MDLRQSLVALIFGLGLCGPGVGQVTKQPVQWAGSLAPATQVRPGLKIVVQLSAEVQKGWHIYGLIQLPGGPTPLRVTLDANDIGLIAGATTGTVPVKKHDTAFDLDTEVYERSFVLYLPVQVNQHVTEGKQQVPVNVRFQACNDQVCLPPRTVHISVPVEISQSN
jgi:DsbC/DsbD-like thiol-disulfide interchange protein